MSAPLSEFFEDFDYFYFSKFPESIQKIASDKAITITSHGFLYYGQVDKNKKPIGKGFSVKSVKAGYKF
jgi:hypothetical protein